MRLSLTATTTVYTRGLAAAGGVVFCALPTLAAAAEAAKPGLPQLDTKLFPEQLFWLFVTFTTLYLLMALVAIPGVKRTQANRQTTILAELEAAEAANDQAKAMIAHYEKVLAEARTEAQTTISNIASAAAKEAAKQQTDQQHMIMKRLQDAEANIKVVRDKAIHDINSNALDLAQTLIERAAGFKINPASAGGRS